jgi:hypothetical protein
MNSTNRAHSRALIKRPQGRHPQRFLLYPILLAHNASLAFPSIGLLHMQYWKHGPNLSDLRSSASGGGHCYSSWKRTVCLRQRLHARLGVKVLKGFQLLFVPRSGMNHASVTVEPAIFPWTIPSIRNYVHHAWSRPPPPRVHSRLTPSRAQFS